MYREQREREEEVCEEGREEGRGASRKDFVCEGRSTAQSRYVTADPRFASKARDAFDVCLGKTRLGGWFQ